MPEQSAALSKEKQKARELRGTAWWKKKISAGTCYYCGKKFPPAELTMDHKIPLARGGTSEKMNLAAACKECNNKKKNLLPTEWEEYMENIRNS
ncbi:MAG: HNH endonuclease [bacterium]|nr:HNH endonuclease [bacterium]